MAWPARRLLASCVSAFVAAVALLGVPGRPVLLAVARAAGAAAQSPRPAPRPIAGAQDPAFAPDGRRLAVSLLDRIQIVTVDGRAGGPIVAWDDDQVVERDPSWSPDGTRIVFAADRGQGFDLYIASARGGPPERLTYLPGDERWPSWGSDGRIVFGARERDQWDLYLVDPEARIAVAPPLATRLTDSPEDDREPAVAPDGTRAVFVSTRESDEGDADLWVIDLPPRAGGPERPADLPTPERVLRARGTESRPAWSPDGRQIAFGAVRDGVGTLWVLPVEPARDDQAAPRPRPVPPPQLLARRLGAPTWSPDGQSIVVADLPDPQPVYNGNPRRLAREAPPVYASPPAYHLRMLPAPRLPDAGERALAIVTDRGDAPWAALFERTWQTLRDLYYASGPAAAEWRGLGDRYRGQAQAAKDASSFERVVDAMVAAQPLVKPAVAGAGAIVVSGHRLASEAGARVLEAGGNVVDAAVAVSFALGVVEPDASGIGGDGMALVWLTSMDAPVVIDFKDQSPMRATLDNPRIFRGGRLVGDGPAAANIPGLVAGMELMARRFGSGRVAWRDLVLPAAALAEDGFVLDATLPTTIAEGRALLAKYPEAARLFLPNGQVPRPGDRFVNRDLGDTLRAVAAEGTSTFYRGALARRIADDMAANGGILTYEDLAQYRAIERTPLSGVFRGHTVYSAPPPVSSGASLIEVLQVMDRYPRTRPLDYASDAGYLHHAIEAWKLRDPIRRVADPALWPVDLGDHLSAAYADSVFSRIDPARAGAFPATGSEEPPPGDDQAERLGRGTTAFVVMDRSGNMVAVTQTLSTWGGAFYASKGLGFLYNNHLHGYRTAPGTYGQLLPLMRSSSTAVPTLVFEGTAESRRPRMAVAAAGNAWITASVYDILLGVIDGGASVQRAIEAPRFLVVRDPADASGRARVQIEDRFPRAVLDDLVARGHAFQKIGRKGELMYGYAAAATLDPATGQVEAGTEPRRAHAAVAVTR